jgi:hypothetical protein
MIPDPRAASSDLLPNPGLDPNLYPAGTQLESAASAVSWPAILAGSATSIAAWLTLFTLGAGLGLAQMASWPDSQPTPNEFRIAVGLWLIVTHWLSFALGGYVAGRMRVRWASLHGDEVFFRDTAHGLLTWATATVLVGGFAVLAAAVAPHAVHPGNAPAVDPDILQKAAAASALFSAVAMLTGAFVAAVAAVIGGRLRDQHP